MHILSMLLKWLILQSIAQISSHIFLRLSIMKKYIKAISISILESAKENAGFNRDIAQIKYDNYNTNPAISVAEFNAQELMLKQAENEYLCTNFNSFYARICFFL